jgi:hypothetical protein
MARWTSDERADMARALLNITEDGCRNGKQLMHLRDTQRGIEAEIERREPGIKRDWETVKGLRALLDLGDMPPYNLDAVLDQTRTDVAAVLAGCGEPATPVTPDSMGPAPEGPTVTQLQDDRIGMLALLAEIYDPNDCRYTSDDTCRTHNYDRRPCPHGRAKAVLRDAASNGPWVKLPVDQP